ncbi:hypothetical protein E4U55_001089 [Claviceps digitariae]|nr:hypothetical protein E4U55_001089 [Claviceps digitariae]
MVDLLSRPTNRKARDNLQAVSTRLERGKSDLASIAILQSLWAAVLYFHLRTSATRTASISKASHVCFELYLFRASPTTPSSTPTTTQREKETALRWLPRCSFCCNLLKQGSIGSCLALVARRYRDCGNGVSAPALGQLSVAQWARDLVSAQPPKPFLPASGLAIDLADSCKVVQPSRPSVARVPQSAKSHSPSLGPTACPQVTNPLASRNPHSTYTPGVDFAVLLGFS